MARKFGALVLGLLSLLQLAAALRQCGNAKRSYEDVGATVRFDDFKTGAKVPSPYYGLLWHNLTVAMQPQRKPYLYPFPPASKYARTPKPGGKVKIAVDQGAQCDYVDGNRYSQVAWTLQSLDFGCTTATKRSPTTPVSCKMSAVAYGCRKGTPVHTFGPYTFSAPQQCNSIGQCSMKSANLEREFSGDTRNCNYYILSAKPATGTAPVVLYIDFLDTEMYLFTNDRRLES